VASGYDQQKAEPMQTQIIPQGGKGCTEPCGTASSSPVQWFLSGSAPCAGHC